MRVSRTLRLAVVVVWFSLGTALASHTLADRVKDGPGADQVRESLRCLDHGDNTDDESAKMTWYARGKALAEEGLAKNERSADANFAYFANWGRMMQTEGWFKNVPNLGALQRYLDRALELDPRHAGALAAKGGLYRQLPRLLGGSSEKAETYLTRAIAADPLAVGARLELAECYLASDREAEARDLSTTALRLAREQGKVRFARRAEELLGRMGDPIAQRSNPD
ncbi:MAG: hypothetical protein QOD06_2859 [Candidatus Binatota bacterium]|jgi:tetratricopeptide (TPR) repeat protein|nr:hypothetical protein [Candidatus Binatota bacterium]